MEHRPSGLRVKLIVMLSCTKKPNQQRTSFDGPPFLAMQTSCVTTFLVHAFTKVENSHQVVGWAYSPLQKLYFPGSIAFVQIRSRTIKSCRQRNVQINCIAAPLRYWTKCHQSIAMPLSTGIASYTVRIEGLPTVVDVVCSQLAPPHTHISVSLLCLSSLFVGSVPPSAHRSPLLSSAFRLGMTRKVKKSLLLISILGLYVDPPILQGYRPPGLPVSSQSSGQPTPA